MKLSNDINQAMLDTENILMNKKNVQVKLQVKRNNNTFKTRPINIQKSNPEKIEKLKKEIEKRFADKQFDEIHLMTSKIKQEKSIVQVVLRVCTITISNVI